MNANNAAKHTDNSEEAPTLTPEEELRIKREDAAERQRLREERSKRIERVATITGFVLMCASFMFGIWAYTHELIQKHFCKSMVDFDSRPQIQYDTGRAYIEAPVNCMQLGDAAYWMSIPAAIGISCIMLAFFATVGFIYSVANMEYVEKLGNMTPKWQRPYFGSLAILGIIFAFAVFLTCLGYIHTATAP